MYRLFACEKKEKRGRFYFILKNQTLTPYIPHSETYTLKKIVYPKIELKKIEPSPFLYPKKALQLAEKAASHNALKAKATEFLQLMKK